MLLDLYKEKKLTGHLMDIQKQAIEFMRTEKPKLMVAWKIEGENNPQYGAMISAPSRPPGTQYASASHSRSIPRPL